jgi:hypothetical protein
MKPEIPVATYPNPIPTGKNFHCTRKGPGRIHNNSTTEFRLKHLPADIQLKERERLNQWPAKVAKFYNRFGFCPVSPVLDLP